MVVKSGDDIKCFEGENLIAEVLKGIDEKIARDLKRRLRSAGNDQAEAIAKEFGVAEGSTELILFPNEGELLKWVESAQSEARAKLRKALFEIVFPPEAKPLQAEGDKGAPRAKPSFGGLCEIFMRVGDHIQSVQFFDGEMTQDDRAALHNLIDDSFRAQKVAYQSR